MSTVILYGVANIGIYLQVKEIIIRDNGNSNDFIAWILNPVEHAGYTLLNIDELTKPISLLTELSDDKSVCRAGKTVKFCFMIKSYL